jgi:hypothetical protein
MAKQYLHLSAYSCDKCDGPVIAGLLAVRENEISKETDVRHVGAICLSCSHRQSKPTAPALPRHFPPVEWNRTDTIDPAILQAAFVDMLDRNPGH